MLIAHARRLTDKPVALRIREGRIAEIASELAPSVGETVFDARGCTVVPGLHDHHIHLRSLAAARDSLPVGPPTVKDRFGMRDALESAVVSRDGWIRAIGYHNSVAGDIDRDALDRFRSDVPIRVQHRSGALWIVNSEGLRRLGLSDHPDGRLFRQDTGVRHGDTVVPDLESVSSELSSMGVTGCTDATPRMGTPDLDYLHEEVRSGRFRQSLHVLAEDDRRERGSFTFGPVKRILDDTDLDVDGLTEWIVDMHEHGQSVAVHCVTVVQLVTTVVALRTAGSRPGDRIEHAAMTPDSLLPELSALGVTVVTQPNFVAERGDQYLAEISPADRSQLWRVASFLRAGVPVAGSTDAPFGSLDPWASMRAARDRITPSNRSLGPRESVTATTALNMFLGGAHRPAVPRQLVVGARADLCILGAAPTTVLAELSRELVTATVVGGEIMFDRT